MQKKYLMTPGPTPVPSEVLLAQARPMIHHRTPDFSAALMEAVTGPKIITDDVKEAMAEALWNIQSGQFARDWILENKAGQPHFKAMRRIQAGSYIEEVGGELRGMFSWLRKE